MKRLLIVLLLSFICAIKHSSPLTFNRWILFKRDKNEKNFCPLENERVDCVEFPLVFNGKKRGKVIEFFPYNDNNLENQRLHQGIKFSFEIWLYVENYCETEEYCGIYQRINGAHKFTPNIFLQSTGEIIVEVVDVKQRSIFAKTIERLPRKDWCRLVFNFNDKKWEAHINCMNQFSKQIHAEFIYKGQNVHHNDVDSIGIIGGSERFPSFTGYIGKFKIFRHENIYTRNLQIAYNHDEFVYNEKDWELMCDRHLFDINNCIKEIRLENSNYKGQSNKQQLIDIFKNTCPFQDTPITHKNSQLCRIINKVLFQQKKTRASLGDHLFKDNLQRLEVLDPSNIKQFIQTLHKASCLGNKEANYILSTIYLYGIGTKSNENLSNKYLMKAALDGDRLSLLSLGNKFNLANHGFPNDLDSAFYYYRLVSDNAKDDIINPKLGESLPMNYWLNENLYGEKFSGDTGDTFNWLKQLARRGVSTAQRDLGDILYWGKQGLKRNFETSAKYFKLGAENNDPHSLYNYAVSEMTGRGVSKNVENAVSNLKSSARLGFSKSLAVLGQNSYYNEKRYEEAFEYWQKGWDEYRDKDCAYYLGLHWYRGTFLNEPKDIKKALYYWSRSAINGQFDSGEMIADFNSVGNEIVKRNPELAVRWAKYLAEKSSILGKYINDAFQAYTNKNWLSSIIYFIIIAESGFESANFNLAYLCEENPSEIATTLIEKECAYYFYNQSLQHNIKYSNGYALNKIGDYHFKKSVIALTHSDKNEYETDSAKAIELYISAFVRNEPQGLFNLGYLIESGYDVPDDLWNKINLNNMLKRPKHEKLIALYQKCVELKHNPDAYLPCLLALYRTKFKSLFHGLDVSGQNTVSIIVLAALMVTTILVAGKLFLN